MSVEAPTKPNTEVASKASQDIGKVAIGPDGFMLTESDKKLLREGNTAVKENNNTKV